MTTQSKKDIRKAQHKDAILKTAHALFSVRGSESVTMDDIAHASQFSKGSLYNYFASKDELINEVVSVNAAIFYEKVSQCVYKKSNYLHRLDELSELFLTSIITEPFITKLLMGYKRIKVSASHHVEEDPCCHGKGLHDVVTSFLEEGIKEKVLKDVDVAGLQYMFIGSIKIFAQSYFEELEQNKTVSISKQERIIYMKTLLLDLFLTGASQ